MKELTYLDNASTTRVCEAAAAAAAEAMRACYGNPSSLHFMGAEARRLLEGARGELALALGAAPEEIFFTSGGSESTNTAIFAGAAKNAFRGRHIVSTQIEHDATLKTLNYLKNQGWEITLVPPERDGSLPAERVAEALREDTSLLCMMAVNNETGATMPYEAAAAELKRKCPQALFYLDAVQAFCKLPVNLKNVDMLGVSAHKIGGMKGCGALYVRAGLKLQPLIHGGGQERGMRSGTEGVPQAAAFGAACREARADMEAHFRHAEALRARLLSSLDGVSYMLNSPEGASPYIVNLSFPPARSEVLIRVLSDSGVCVSGGSACARGRQSHVLKAMRLPGERIDSALRVSFSPQTDEEDIARFCAALQQALTLF